MNKALFGFFQSKMAARGSGFAVQVGNLFFLAFMLLHVHVALHKSWQVYAMPASYF